MSTGRPREFDEKQALLAAMQYFWQYGYETTSLQDLLATMGLSKSSFYQTFGSKNALFQQCLDHYRNDLSAEMARNLNQAKSALAFIRSVFDDIIKEADQQDEPKGCLLMNTASEFSQRDPAITQRITKGNDKFIALFRKAIARAQQENDIAKHRSSLSLARYIINNISGLRTLAKAGVGQTELQDIVETVMRSLQSKQK